MFEEEALDRYGPDNVGVPAQHAKNTDRCICDSEDDAFIKVISQRKTRWAVQAHSRGEY